MLAALERRIPDRIPTLELEFQLSPELAGRDFLTEEGLKNASPKETERLLHENAVVSVNPHAIRSLDPMAGVDIAKVKRMVGDQVALIGNVNCALMQTGTLDEVTESAMYCLTHGKPGGGYIFSTSNVPFRGLPLSRYLHILDIWKRHRDY